MPVASRVPWASRTCSTAASASSFGSSTGCDDVPTARVGGRRGCARSAASRITSVRSPRLRRPVYFTRSATIDDCPPSASVPSQGPSTRMQLAVTSACPWPSTIAHRARLPETSRDHPRTRDARSRCRSGSRRGLPTLRLREVLGPSARLRRLRHGAHWPSLEDMLTGCLWGTLRSIRPAAPTRVARAFGGRRRCARGPPPGHPPDHPRVCHDHSPRASGADEDVLTGHLLGPPPDHRRACIGPVHRASPGRPPFDPRSALREHREARNPESKTEGKIKAWCQVGYK